MGPQTCQVCHSVRPHTCTLESHYSGAWYDAIDLGQLALSIDNTTVSVYSQNSNEQLHCIEFDPETSASPNSFEKTRMLVRGFNNGCRPRYSCVQFMQKSSTALFFRLSQGQAWPFTSSPSDAIDCSSFRYAGEASLMPNKFRSSTFNLVYSLAPTAVDCDLPHVRGNYAANFKSGQQCAAEVSQPGDTSLSVTLRDCDVSWLSQEHTCMDSSRMFDRRDLMVITRARHDPDLIHCWVIPRRQRDVIYLIGATDCDDTAGKRLHRGRLKPLVTFTRRGTLPTIDYTSDTAENELPEVGDTPTIPPRFQYSSTTTPKYSVDSSPDAIDVIDAGKNATSYEHAEAEITVASTAVVSIVLVMAVLQTFCVCC